ncbi:hypothetical protein GWK47_030008 [Chionoecetes opilio]|uniref:Uncharacterized protein n=1 Tax=Chionoecetes opilio TaxID=41210 RepID=A0A8J5D5D6_CHIOP|nr:hypothetical protein GWK47_030008 [Chionoecetes opilio]
MVPATPADTHRAIIIILRAIIIILRAIIIILRAIIIILRAIIIILRAIIILITDAPLTSWYFPTGIHALKIVGRVGVGGSAQDHVMSEVQPGHAHHPPSDDVTRFNGDVTGRDNQSASVISQVTDGEFEHDTADYQWLLDYEYRESYSREVGSASLSSTGRDGSGRVSVLEASRGPLQDLSYETLARNLDANLAEIDMDDFHSEDIHNLLTLPTMCGEFQSAGDGEMFASVSGSMMNKIDLGSSVSPHSSSHGDDEDEDAEYKEEEEEELASCGRRDDEEYSGVSGELSLYQSGPLFSPLKEPPPLANTTFSVDSLDCDSLHDDLILTCQANKDNYTIAFEGSFVQYSEDSDYHEAGVCVCVCVSVCLSVLKYCLNTIFKYS